MYVVLHVFFFVMESLFEVLTKEEEEDEKGGGFWGERERERGI